MNVTKLVISISTALFLLSFSCSKSNPVIQEEPTPKAKYLSRIVLNDKIVTKYFYGNANLVDSVNTYDSSGIISTQSEYQYSNGRPIIMLYKYFDPFYSSTVPVTTYRYESQFNSSGFASRISMFRANPDSLMFYDIYSYDGSNKCSKISRYSSKDSIQLYWTCEYERFDIIRIKYYSPTDSLAVTASYIRDTCNNITRFMSTTFTNPNHHNALSVYSTATDSTGRINFKIGKTTGFISAYTSVFQYDADNYPVMETKTATAAIPVASVYRYEYLP